MLCDVSCIFKIEWCRHGVAWLPRIGYLLELVGHRVCTLLHDFCWLLCGVLMAGVANGDIEVGFVAPTNEIRSLPALS